MLTLTQLRKNVEGRWQSDTLEFFPELISEDSMLWVDITDPSESEIQRVTKNFNLGALDLSGLISQNKSEIEEQENCIICRVIFPKPESFISKAELEKLLILMGKKMDRHNS